jgi:hypothetical protein
MTITWVKTLDLITATGCRFGNDARLRGKNDVKIYHNVYSK